MLYDIKAHLPQVVESLREDFRTGNVNQLEASKIFITKLLDDDFKNKIKIIDDEYIKRKTKLNTKYLDVDKKRNDIVAKLGENEANYWETIIGEVIRNIKNIEDTIVVEDE